jgi:hypothetical protein
MAKLEERAAAYFGWNGESRAVVKIDRYSCFIAAPAGKSATRLAYYHENTDGTIETNFWYLDEQKRKRLEVALGV